MAKKTETTTTEITTTAPAAPITHYDYGDHAVDIGQAGHGFENQGIADQAIPFIKCLQPQSPEILKKQVPGAEAGQFCNALTGRLWRNPEGLLFVPSITKNEWVAWRDTKKGGGISGRYAVDSKEVAAAKAASKEFGEYFVQGNAENAGDVLVDTFYVYGIYCDEEMSPMGPGILTFKSTTIKAYKAWMTQLRMQTVQGKDGSKKMAPLYAHLCRLTTIEKQNNDGVWYVPQYAPAIDGKITASMLPLDSELFQHAYQFYKIVSSGAAKVDFSQEEGGGAPKSGEAASPF